MVLVESTISVYKTYGSAILKIIQHRRNACASGSRRSLRTRWRQRWEMGHIIKYSKFCPADLGEARY